MAMAVAMAMAMTMTMAVAVAIAIAACHGHGHGHGHGTGHGHMAWVLDHGTLGPMLAASTPPRATASIWHKKDACRHGGAPVRRSDMMHTRWTAGSHLNWNAALKAVRFKRSRMHTAHQSLRLLSPSPPLLDTFRGRPPHARNCPNAVSGCLGGHPGAV